MAKKYLLLISLFCYFSTVKLKNITKKKDLSSNQSAVPFFDDVMVKKDAATLNNVTITIPLLSPTIKQGIGEICKDSIHHQGMFGSIVSPFYPKEYANNISCLWGVRAPLQHVIGIKIGEFILEGGMQEKSDDGKKLKEEKCTFDFLYIFEQRPGGSGIPLIPDSINFRHNIGTFCGYVPPTTLHSTIPGSRVYFYFRSDSSKTAKGFNLVYRIIPETDTLSTHLTNINENNFDEVFPITKEEEFLKVFSFIIFIFIFCTVVVGTLYKCWQSTAEQIAMDGHAQHSCCCGAVQLDVIAADRRRYCCSPRLPTPPPEYGEIVKTEEEWNRVIQQLGVASAAALRQRMENEELQVTYDLHGAGGTTDGPSSRAITSTPVGARPPNHQQQEGRVARRAERANGNEVEEGVVRPPV